jgi:hypothetical protein
MYPHYLISTKKLTMKNLLAHLSIILLPLVPFIGNSQDLNYVAARMDLIARGEAMVRESYAMIAELKLKNKENIAKYNNYINNKTITLTVRKRVRRKIYTEQFTYKLFGDFNLYLRRIDLGDYDNASFIAKQFEEILNDPTIASEINVLQKISSEIINLKTIYPSDYYNRERYTEMMNALQYMENCSAKSIDDMLYIFKLY